MLDFAAIEKHLEFMKKLADFTGVSSHSVKVYQEDSDLITYEAWATLSSVKNKTDEDFHCFCRENSVTGIITFAATNITFSVHLSREIK